MWALAHTHYVEGRLLLAGYRINDLTLRELLNVVLAIRVEGHPLASLDDALKGYADFLATPLFASRERWGITEEEWDARMATLPPAPPRDPNAQRPARREQT
jgi:hypothetical protein